MWSKLDREKRVWRIPASRMKTARKLGNGGPLVFPLLRGKAGREHGDGGPAQGLKTGAVRRNFRSSFRDRVAKELTRPREAAEAGPAQRSATGSRPRTDAPTV